MAGKQHTNIYVSTLPKLTWAYVTATDQKTLDALHRRFGFLRMDLRETRPPLQRPKLVVREDYLFMILLYPILDKTTKTVRTVEVDFFISKDLLVTVNAGRIKDLERLFNACSAGEKTKADVYVQGDITHVLYRVLDELLESVFPMVVELSDYVTSIEQRMFTEFDRNLIKELLRVKTNIVSVRKAIQGHKGVIRQLVKEGEGRFPIHRLEAYFQHLVEQTKDLWDTLEIQRDTIDALHETNSTLIDFRINQIMKTLTIFSVIVFPLTLFATIFTMKTVYTPLVDRANGFWIIISLMALVTLGMLAIFRKKHWI